jgi:predicted GH43/DUF377 family glycosyl hydrolase
MKYWVLSFQLFFISFLQALNFVDDYFSDSNEIEESILVDPEVSAYNPALLDLEMMAQEFVLKTKQIKVKNYPGSFNPSIIRWRGSLLLSFRTRDPVTKSTDGIGLVFLDKEFNPIGSPQILSIQYPEKRPFSKQQDPRLVEVGERLFLVYNNLVDPISFPELRRMHYVELIYQDHVFYPQTPQIITDYPHQRIYRQEKNWTPFAYQDELLLIYTISPHIIYHPIPGTSFATTFAENKMLFPWQWGVLRGGTPALKVGDEYLSFYHSSIPLPTLHSQGKNRLHYFMGAYTFSSSPPFEVTRMSPHPIIGKTFYTGPAYKTWKPLRVVFPGGFVFDENFIWVVFGKQDFEMWVVQLDRKKLFESLQSVEK